MPARQRRSVSTYEFARAGGAVAGLRHRTVLGPDDGRAAVSSRKGRDVRRRHGACCANADAVEVWRTEDLDPGTRALVIDLCIAAHDTDAFERLFDHVIPSGGRHFLGLVDGRLVSHAVVTTRGLQLPPGAVLRTAFVDAVSTFSCRRTGRRPRSCAGLERDRRLRDRLPTDGPRRLLRTRTGWSYGAARSPDANEDGLTHTPEQRGVMVLKGRHQHPNSTSSRCS